MDKYILIVGGAGYIGSHINLELNRRGYNTLVFDNLSYGHKELVRCGKFIEGDLSKLKDIDNVLTNFNVLAVIHVASYISVGESFKEPYKYYENNVTNTLNLLKCMLDRDIRILIFSSTAALYGLPKQIPIPETAPLAPINPYGRTKLMIENILADFNDAYDFRYVSLRYFNAAGADKGGLIGEWHIPETHLIPLVLDAALDQEKYIRVFGTDYDTPDGTCIRDYIHVTDLAIAHIQALEYLLDGGKSNIFNLGNGKGFSVMEIIDTAREVTGKEIRSLEIDRRPGDPPILIGDANKIRDILNWQPHYPDLDKIIDSAWKWQQNISK